jgi:hypothetical protein
MQGKYKNKSFDLNDMNPNIQILQENEHTHEEDDDMIGKNEALYQMKDAVREDATVPIKRVYNKVVRAMNRGGGDREHIPEFHRIRTSISRTRLEHVPAVPHTVHDITIEDTWRETWSGDNFFLHKDNDWGILVFTTDENLICLQRWTVPSAQHLLRIDSTLVYTKSSEIGLSA